MSNTLISIAGIDHKMENILRLKAQIRTLKQFCDATRTPEDRASLAQKTRISLANIALWSTQAELLRINTMTYNWAYDLVEIGIFSIEQLKKTNEKEIFENIKEINPNTTISENIIQKLKNSTFVFAKTFDYTSIEEEMTASLNTMPSIYTDLSSVITELGKGVAQAQHELDLNSMDIQNRILQNDELYGMGLQATWYVMPEVEFSMKIDYAVSEERSETGSVQIGVAPSNATYSNLFKSSKKEESTIKLKIVPIPANDKFSVRRYMPDLKKIKTIGDLKAELERYNISMYKIDPEDASNWNDETNIKIEEQDPTKNTILKINEIPEIKVKKI